MSICLSKSNTNVSVLLGTPKRRKNIFTNLTFSGLEQRWVCGNHDTNGQTLVDDLLMCSLYINVLLRYTIFASVFQFILPLLIIASIYALICRYLGVRLLLRARRFWCWIRTPIKSTGFWHSTYPHLRLILFHYNI